MFMNLTNDSSEGPIRINLLNVTAVLSNPTGGTVVHTNGPLIFYVKESFEEVSRIITASCR